MDKVRLAIDIESGDFGPSVVMAGVLKARQESKVSFQAYLCGHRESIEPYLIDWENSTKGSREDFFLEHCPGRISENDSRARVWKTHNDSSIIRSITLQKEGKVQASVSAGDTGILMGAAIFILGRREGVVRPALAAFLPTIKKQPVLLLDIGANLNCRSEHLVSFAMIGSQYVRERINIETPTVMLLNIGKEAIKGTSVICDAGKILEKRLDGYSGFTEGNRVLTGEADVVVCDGFVGNVLLKTCESFYVFAASLLGNEPDLLDRVKNMTKIDPESYGAAPLLGIKGNVFKAHGGSSSRAIANAIMAAIASVKKNISPSETEG